MIYHVENYNLYFIRRIPKPMNRNLLFFIIVLITMGIVSVPPAVLGRDTGRNVLVLNSYHKGYLWSDEIVRGLEETMQGRGVNLHIEYMDTKRLYRFRLLNLIAETLKIKHEKQKYDLVIATDDNAFQFMKKWEDYLFGGIPVVFCGVNYLAPDDLNGYPNFTGVNEKVYIKGNLALIRRLHPRRKHIIMIADDTTTGRQIRKEITRVAALPENQGVTIDVWKDLSVDGLGERVRGAARDSVILFTVFSRGTRDTYIDYEQALAVVADASPVPVYTCQNFQPGPKVVGGLLTNGYDQGVMAAEMALRILDGAQVSEVPVFWGTPVHARFDSLQLKKWGLSDAGLPKGSEVLNRPVSFYEEYREIIWTTVGAFCLLLIAVLGLGFGLMRSRQAEKRLAESEKQYR